LVIGNAVHGALAAFFGLAPDVRDLDVLHRCLRTVWKEHAPPGTFASREEEGDHGRSALALLTSFFENFDTQLIPLTRERWLAVRLPNGVEVYGKVDRLNGIVEPNAAGVIDIVDYKTGRHTLESEDLADEAAAQAYLLAGEAEYRREVRRVRYLYLAPGSEARWEPEREDVEAVRAGLMATTDAMLADRKFEARPGPHCQLCPFAHVCPDDGRVELTDLDVPDDIAF
jgi:RecB family exonuclease